MPKWNGSHWRVLSKSNPIQIVEGHFGQCTDNVLENGENEGKHTIQGALGAVQVRDDGDQKSMVSVELKPSAMIQETWGVVTRWLWETEVERKERMGS